MSFRSNVLLQLGTITAIVDVDNAIGATEGLKNVCLGPASGPTHVPTALKQSLKCPDCGNADMATMKKASVSAGQFTVVEKTEVADAKASAVGATNKFISLTAHPAEQFHAASIQGGSAYQLKASNQGMVQVLSLLLDTIRRHSELAFTALWTPAGRPNLYEVRTFGDTLVMEQRCRTEDLKVIQQPFAAIDPAFQKQVDAILSVSVQQYDPATYQDAYLKRLAEVLATKTAEEGVLPAKSKGTTSTPVGSVDLSAMLGAGLKAAGLVTP